MIPRSHKQEHVVSPELAERIQQRWGVVYEVAERTLAVLEPEVLAAAPQPVIEPVADLEIYRRRREAAATEAGPGIVEGLSKEAAHIAELERIARREAS